ncbi:MAG: hypothetical protein ACD_2C00042G0006 [uncultured bacterium (gcode 4)]|uniref:Uncharacterized protein n=1 Tax=uncultured bacterium (gcode 4) TaxID=1234023 RepID=K2G706_9BACT|nr:MAG: hypothetical protein ACD_2C00042G0006 [uncultured bacterium (gcode 4)]
MIKMKDAIMINEPGLPHFVRNDKINEPGFPIKPGMTKIDYEYIMINDLDPEMNSGWRNG